MKLPTTDCKTFQTGSHLRDNGLNGVDQFRSGVAGKMNSVLHHRHSVNHFDDWDFGAPLLQQESHRFLHAVSKRRSEHGNLEAQSATCSLKFSEVAGYFYIEGALLEQRCCLGESVRICWQ